MDVVCIFVAENEAQKSNIDSSACLADDCISRRGPAGDAVPTHRLSRARDAWKKELLPQAEEQLHDAGDEKTAALDTFRAPRTD